jgi:hypothetical protein
LINFKIIFDNPKSGAITAPKIHTFHQDKN